MRQIRGEKPVDLTDESSLFRFLFPLRLGKVHINAPPLTSHSFVSAVCTCAHLLVSASYLEDFESSSVSAWKEAADRKTTCCSAGSPSGVSPPPPPL